MTTADNRIALVTGAGRGLGRAIAERLAMQQGATLVIADIDAEQAERTAAELRQSGLVASALALDVADEASVAAACREIDRRHGRLDIVVNNAGIAGLQDGARPPIEQMTLATWERTLRVNLTGTFLVCRAAIPLMRRHRWGRIVNISSRAARNNPRLKISNYAASKAGVIGFSRALADEVGGDGITVNCVAPGRIVTAMTLGTSGGGPEYFAKVASETVVGRIGEPFDVAHAVAFLCAEASSFLTGLVIDVNGGQYMP